MSHTVLARTPRILLLRSNCKASACCSWSSRSYTIPTTATPEANISSVNSKFTAPSQSAEQRTTQYSSDRNASFAQPHSLSSSSSSPLLTTGIIPHLPDEHTSRTTTPLSLSPNSITSSSSYPQNSQSSQPPPISENIRQLLPLLKAQERHYITIHIHDKPYLVTPGDVVRLPFLMHGVVPGDILRLNRASVLGSRDFTLKAGAPIIIGNGDRGGGAGDNMAMSSMTMMMSSDNSSNNNSSSSMSYDENLQATENPDVDAETAKFMPETCHVDGQDVGLVPGAMRRMQYIDDRLFECRAVVMGTEAEPMRFIKKKKQRNRRVKTVKSKHKYTILKIKELVVKDVDEVVGKEGTEI